MLKCNVCSVNDHKYKCPKCLILYCSVSCYKNHKENCEIKVNNAQEQDISENLQPLPPLTYDYISADTVLPEKLEKLRDSEEMERILHNPHLRTLLTNLSKSDKPAKDIRDAMQEPLFVEFADECLRLIEPQEEDDSD